MSWKRRGTKVLLGGALVGGATYFGARYYFNTSSNSTYKSSRVYSNEGKDVSTRNNPQMQEEGGNSSIRPKYTDRLPSRKEQLAELQKPKQVFDLLIIGGGATGAGVALDAVTRGLNVALVEKEDFSAGASSKSTKLIHGGVRYLEKAVKNLDWQQYQMVRNALQERSTLLHIAPHLTYALPIMLPIYKWYQVPYFWVGSKLYDLLAGSQSLQNSYFLSRSRALEKFPWLRSDSLVGAMVYYDGAHNDARTCIALALTAASYGAKIANHTTVLNLIHDKKTKQVIGATVQDNLTGKKWNIHARGVINATGPFVDTIRKNGYRTRNS